MSSDLDALRSQYSLASVIGQYTEFRSKMICPFPDHIHSNMTPSFSVHTDRDGVERFKCFGHCGHSGDVIDFVGYMNVAGYDKNNPQHVMLAASMLGQRPPGKAVRLRRRKPPLQQATAKSLVGLWSRSLDRHARDYLEMRGVLSVAERFKLGYRYQPPQYAAYKSKGCVVPGHHISIPTIRGDYIVGVKFRRIDTHPDYQGVDCLPLRYDSLSGKNIGASKVGVFNYNEVAFTTDVVFSPEGELDALLIAALGFKAACLNGGANAYSDDLLVLAHANTIILADKDDAGLHHARSKSERLPGSTIESVPGGDVGHLYQERGKQYVEEWLSGLHNQRTAQR